MLKNLLAAALRNLLRNRVHATINILGLTVGFAAAMFALLYVRDEFGFDRWIPGYENIYRVSPEYASPGRASMVAEPGPAPVAAWLKADLPQVKAAARLSHADSLSLKHGLVEGNEGLFWADPDFFDVVPLPVVAGDPRRALEQPDGLVMTRALARKYFGRDDPVGQSIQVTNAFAQGWQTMQVLAVIEDLPSNSHFNLQLLGSSRAPFSQLARLDANPDPVGSLMFRAHTYVRLAPGASGTELQAAMPAFLKAHMGSNPVVQAGGVSLTVMALPDIHFAPSAQFMFKPRGSRSAVYAILLVGGLIVLVASINFINLTTARATRRATEIGVRKAAGASKRSLIAQFLGESLLYCVIGAVMAVALVELLLPYFNAYLQRSIRFEYWSDPQLALSLVLLVLLAGLAAGAYPAFVMAAFAPGRVLKQARVQSAESGRVRALLVVAQFSILIVLLVCAAVVYRQTQYSMNEAMRLDRDHVLIVDYGCREGFMNRVTAMAGVRSVGCASAAALEMDIYGGALQLGDRPMVDARSVAVDFGFFETYGLAPVAGRTFSRQFGADQTPEGPGPFVANILVNEAAVRALGLSSPKDAVGQMARTVGLQGAGSLPAQIVGVVPDYHFSANREPVGPSMFLIDRRYAQGWMLNVKLTGERIPETLREIDVAWRDAGMSSTISRRFVDQYVQDLYLEQTRQSALLGALTAIALCIAALGLFGLTVFAVERRTREIGVRKALGASSGNILSLLLWQFSRPVLWASLISLPLAAWLMHRWLQGFAYRIDLPLWLLPVASGVALGIALATVGMHVLRVSRAKPVQALRYE